MKTASSVLMLLLLSALVSATYPGFIVEAPSQVCAGEEFTITIRVGHPNQQGFHFLERMRLYVNDALAKEWTYGTSKTDYWNEVYSMRLNSDAFVKVSGRCTITGWSTFSELGTKKISVIQCAAGAVPRPIQVTVAPQVIQPTAVPPQASPPPQVIVSQEPEAGLFLAVIAFAIIVVVIALLVVWKKIMRFKRETKKLHEKRKGLR